MGPGARENAGIEGIGEIFVKENGHLSLGRGGFLAGTIYRKIHQTAGLHIHRITDLFGDSDLALDGECGCYENAPDSITLNFIARPWSRGGE